MRNVRICFFAIFAIVMSVLTLCAESPRDKGLSLVRRVDTRKEPESSSSILSMTMTDSRGATRRRTVHIGRHRTSEAEYSMLFFSEPADVRGVGLLSIEREGAQSDQWLWMPALKKTRRVASSSRGDSFMGTDFSFEDMEGRSPEKDMHTWVREDMQDGTVCQVVESVPLEKGVYSRRLLWIDAERDLIVRIDFYASGSEPVKRLLLSDIRTSGSYLEAGKLEMTDLVKKRSTRLDLLEWNIDVQYTPAQFSAGNLERGRLP